MDRLKRQWKKVPAAVRKPLVLIVGFAIIVTGIAMLVLPGPGWAAIFLGFAVLATEFAFAERVRDWAVVEVKKLARNTQRAWKKFRRPKSKK
ncbi:MAG: PGPGW domain-containing protein [Candidatus Saccharimonadales bacterium]